MNHQCVGTVIQYQYVSGLIIITSNLEKQKDGVEMMYVLYNTLFYDHIVINVSIIDEQNLCF